jgi:uncharacterized metal-binding protein
MVCSIGAWLHVLKFVVGLVVPHVAHCVHDVIEIEKKTAEEKLVFTLML